MNKKRLLAYVLVAAVLAALFYVQFRTWRRFDWDVFLSQTREVTRGWGPIHIFLGIAFTYIAYFMRAVRWRIFLRPVKKTTSAALVAPTLIGFTGIALLGRLGEMIRPYLIARKLELPFSSQLAVWTVERIFDFGGFAVLLICAIFLPGGTLRTLPYYGQFRKGGLLLVAFVAGLAIAAWIISAKGESLAAWIERRSARHGTGLGHKLAARVREFRGGLNTIHGLSEFVQLAAVSIGMWFLIALAYEQVVRAYAAPLHTVVFAYVFLLMFASMLGSLVQLPGVGGGSQLATITTLQRVFDIPPEVAASCGILLWMVTFMTVIPTGLVLAHRERLSLRKLSRESQAEEGFAEA
jgi:glycosyltransferase 2 family protein